MLPFVVMLVQASHGSVWSRTEALHSIEDISLPRYALGTQDVGGINLFYVHDHDSDAAAETKAHAWLTEAFPDRTVRKGAVTMPTEADLRNVLVRVAEDLSLEASFLLPEANDNAVTEFVVEPPASA